MPAGFKSTQFKDYWIIQIIFNNVLIIIIIEFIRRLPTHCLWVSLYYIKNIKLSNCCCCVSRCSDLVHCSDQWNPVCSGCPVHHAHRLQADADQQEGTGPSMYQGNQADMQTNRKGQDHHCIKVNRQMQTNRKGQDHQCIKVTRQMQTNRRGQDHQCIKVNRQMQTNRKGQDHQCIKVTGQICRPTGRDRTIIVSR